MAVAPAALVPGQPRLPLPYGLFSTATMRPPGDRWENGVKWEQQAEPPLGGLPAYDCDDSDSDGIDFGEPYNVPDAAAASAFSVYGFFAATPVGFTQEDAEQRAIDHLLTYEEARVEEALWTGSLSNTPTLEGSATTLTSDASEYAKGIGLLEEAMSSLGVIHMTRTAALVGLSKDVLEAGNGRLRTRLGTPVVAGAGYPGTDPQGDEADDGETWAYTTPQLFIYRSEVNIPTGPIFDRGNNTLFAVAERQYLIGFDATSETSAVQLTL